MHENHSVHDDDIKMGSERSFAVVFATVFVIIALWPLIDGGTPRLWAFGLAAGFLLAGFLKPRILRPLNRLWFRFGMVLHHVVTPLVLGAMYVIVIVPAGLLMRMLGKDPMGMRPRADSASHWIVRTPPGPDPSSMKNQF